MASGDITQHAEQLVIRKAQKKFPDFDLSQCTLYTNCEPCPMCAFVMRELKFKRVVFAVPSPWMGGFSRWDILQDKDLERFGFVFGKAPEVLGGILKGEALKVFRRAGWGLMLKEKGKNA